MISKSERKKILKLLKSKRFVERLDGLHGLKAVGVDADFAISELESLVRKDADDLVKINALDILATISEKSGAAELFIKNAINSESMGVRKKAEKLLAKIEQREDERFSPQEEAPLTNELFEKVEQPIVDSIPVPEAAVVNNEQETEITFNLEEFSIGETTELQPSLTQDIPKSPSTTPSMIPEPPQETPPSTPEAVPEPIPELIPEIPETPPSPPPEFIPSLKDDEIELVDLGDALLENSLKNLLLLSKKKAEITTEDSEIAEDIKQKVGLILDQISDHLNQSIGIEKAEDFVKFVDHQFDETDTEYLRNIVLLFSSKLQDMITDTDSIPSLILMGTVAQKLDLLDETMGIYDLVLSLDESNLTVINNLGLLYAKMDKIDEAIDLFTKATELDKENARYLATLGDLYSFKKQDYDKAVEYYSLSLEIDASLYTIGMNLASSLSKQEKYDEATSVLHKCLKTNSEIPDLWLNYAILLVKQLKFQESLEAYSKALEFAPEEWAFRSRAEAEKARVEQIIETPEYSESKDEELEYMVDKDKKAKIARVFIFSENPIDDKVYLATFDWFRLKKHKYSIPDDLEPLFGNIMNKDDFPIDPLRSKDFADVIWNQHFGEGIELSKFHYEMFDLEEYDKIIFFMEEE